MPVRHYDCETVDYLPSFKLVLGAKLILSLPIFHPVIKTDLMPKAFHIMLTFLYVVRNSFLWPGAVARAWRRHGKQNR
jgi:hypothetical protein